MDKSLIVSRLRRHKPELQAFGIQHLLVHGSYARGSETVGASDVDLIAEFDSTKRLTLLDMGRIESRLTDIICARVDLSPAGTLKEPVREKASREGILAF